MPNSRLSQRGTNLFQTIKDKCREAEKRGQKLYRLSIGQPMGPALLNARKAAAKAVMSEEESMHKYQDNYSFGVPNFAEKFIQQHLKNSLAGNFVNYLSIPGIKPMLGLIPLACNSAKEKIRVATMTEPGYPTPADWCNYLNIDNYALPLNSENEFRFNVKDIKDGTDLLMLNYPHNPSGQIATQKYWEDICQYCADSNIRIFNDAAYAVLAYSDKNSTLTDVAVKFSKLSWTEAFSASKTIANGAGWRVGAMVGSPDFISDIKIIKGNTDSGFVAPMAAGVIAAFENDQQGIDSNKEMYHQRVGKLIKILTSRGMRLAVVPDAGFFTLWKLPNIVFGQKIKNAEQFNFLMIEKTGIVGVHFDPYIRYAACGDIDAMADAIDEGFKRAGVKY